MTRLDNDLISRKALLEVLDTESLNYHEIINLITNAPTIEADSGEAVTCIVSSNYCAAKNNPLYASPPKHDKE